MIWDDHFQEGRHHGSKGELESAAEAFRKAVNLAPDEPYPVYELAYTLMRLKRYEAALACYKRVDQLSRGFMMAQTEAYLCQQRIDGSIDDDALVACLNMQIWIDSGDNKRVAKTSHWLIEHYPGLALGYLHAGKSCMAWAPEDAKTLLKTCIGLNGDDTTTINALVHLGLLHQNQGNTCCAQGIFQVVMDVFHDNPQAHVVRNLIALNAVRIDQG